MRRGAYDFAFGVEAVFAQSDVSDNFWMDPTDFLSALVPGYADLSDEERSAIANFTLLWSAMEGRMIQSNANPASLAEVVKALNEPPRKSRRPVGLSQAATSVT